jgi:hypothetical protein
MKRRDCPGKSAKSSAACVIKGVSGKWPPPVSIEAYRKGAA